MSDVSLNRIRRSCVSEQAYLPLSSSESGCVCKATSKGSCSIFRSRILYCSQYPIDKSFVFSFHTVDKNNLQEEGLKLMNEAIDIAPTDNLKRIKRSLLDLMINPPKDDSEFKSRNPHLKENTFIPLY